MCQGKKPSFFEQEMPLVRLKNEDDKGRIGGFTMSCDVCVLPPIACLSQIAQVLTNLFLPQIQHPNSAANVNFGIDPGEYKGLDGMKERVRGRFPSCSFYPILHHPLIPFS